MNYYRLHIGDYLRDTSHLSLLEHGVYTRLLQIYYTREAPIPDADKFRLIGARSRDERQAVDCVLQEFFALEDGVWKQARCERELEVARDSQEESEARRENERERQRRHRERRKELFSTLRQHGVVPAYDTPTTDLEAALVRVTSRPVTRDVTVDATAIHKPLANSQYPETKEQGQKRGNGADAPPAPQATAKSSRKAQKRPLPDDFGISDDVAAWAAEHGHDRLDEHLGAFRRKCLAKGYQYVDWDAAFMEAVRENWAKLGVPQGPADRRMSTDEFNRREAAAFIAAGRDDSLTLDMESTDA